MFRFKKSGGSRLISVIDSNAPFQVLEAYKKLRLNISFALPHTKCKTIILTSSLPGEGKSTSCVNLAITLAQTGSRVLIIDCDLRKPRIHRYFHMKSEPGLTNYLCGYNRLEEILVKTPHENLCAIFSGPVPPNPAELLDSGEMSSLLTSLADSYDYIIIDMPPVNVVSDALILSKLVSGTIIVVRQGYSTHDELKKTIESFKLADSKLLGFVLNDARENDILGYKKYRYDDYYDKSEEE